MKYKELGYKLRYNVLGYILKVEFVKKNPV